MSAYDWSKVSPAALGRFAIANLNYDQHATGERSNEVVASREACHAEALVPPLRPRAEVDAEIGKLVREYVEDVGARDAFAFSSMQRDRQRLLALAAEPLAPDLGRIIDCEFPEAAEPCSCEESERLKARITELEDKGYRAAALLIEAQQQASQAEARARELENEVEQRKADCRVEFGAHESTIANLTALREQCNRQEHGFARRESALQGELAALHERIDKAVAVLSTGQCRNCCPEALRFLRD